MRTEYLATYPALWGHRNTATLTVMVPPETGCFFLAAAVYDNLDCSDVIDSPHFSIATKLLEVMDSHLLLLVLPSPLSHEHTGRACLWSLCRNENATGVSPLSCWHSSHAVADVSPSWETFKWDSKLPVDAARQAVCHSPPHDINFAGSHLSTWTDQIAMAVSPGGLYWTPEQPHKPLHHCPRRKCVQASEYCSSCQWEGCLCEGTGAHRSPV